MTADDVNVSCHHYHFKLNDIVIRFLQYILKPVCKSRGDKAFNMVGIVSEQVFECRESFNPQVDRSVSKMRA